MKYKVYTDLHSFAPNELKLAKSVNSDEWIFLGDNHDRANCKKEYLPILNGEIAFYKDFLGERYILGNHERMGIPEGFKHNYFVANKTVFSHGDLESNFKKWSEYRNKPPGAGFLKRSFVHVIEFIEQFRESVDNEQFYKNAYAIAKAFDCDNYVCGHFHPKEKIVKKYKDVTITILPRGMTEVEV